MRKLLLYGCLLLLAVMGVLVYNYNSHLTLSGLSVTPTPAAWQPVRVRIPNLHIDASVINVGATASGLMDAPVSKAVNSPYWASVFWYDRGAAPGQAGNAVIAGHVNRVDDSPAIFWSLSRLQPGDTVVVLTMEQKELHFVVDRVVNYPADAPGKDVLNNVFGPTTAHHLNLITCSGVWTGKGYDQRLVAFTTQVDT